MALSEALGEPINSYALTPLPESDALMREFRNGYQAVTSSAQAIYQKFFLLGEETSVFKLADCMAELLAEDVYLLTKWTEECGAVKLSSAGLLRRAKSVIKLDRDSLSLISLDQVEGLLIDYNPDDQQQTYEISVWGKRWPTYAFECDPEKSAE